MKLEDYLDTLEIILIVQRYPNQENRWSARFENCEIKEGSGLTSAHGNGTTPFEAIADYIEQIRGQRIIFNAMSPEYRREYTVPMRLSKVIDMSLGTPSTPGASAK